MNTAGISPSASVTTAALRGAAPSGGPASLLPSPPPGDGVDDALGQIMKMASDLNTLQSATGTSTVTSANARRTEIAEKRKELLLKAVDAERKAAEAKESGGLFGFIEDHLGVAGLVGLAAIALSGPLGSMAFGSSSAAVASSGLDMVAADFTSHLVAPDDSTNALDGAAVIAGPMAFAVEQVVSKMDPGDVREAADKLGSVKDEDLKVAKKIALALVMAEIAVGTTVATGGTSAAAIVALVGIGISTTTQVMQDTGALKEVFGDKASYVALGGQITGAALTLGGSVATIGKSADAAVKLADALQKGKSFVEGAYEIDQGVRNLEAAGYVHDADESRADAKAKKKMLDFIASFVDGVLDDLRDVKESADRASGCLQETMQIHNSTLLMAGSMKV